MVLQLKQLFNFPPLHVKQVKSQALQLLVIWSPYYPVKQPETQDVPL